MEPTKLIRDLEIAGKARGISVANLCARAEVDRASWQRWKAGRTKPQLDTWQRLIELRQALGTEEAAA